MEEEGIYYFYVPVSGGKIDIILTDSASGHKPVEGKTTLKFIDRDLEGLHQENCIYEWNGSERVVTGKVTLNDYNFEKPKAKMQSLNVIPKETHSEKKHEFYDYPGHYRETDRGDQYARVIMESNAITFHTWVGLSNVSTIGVGRTFKVSNHQRTSDSVEYLVTKAKHFLRLDPIEKIVVKTKSFLESQLNFDENDDDPYRVIFDVTPDKEQYRAPKITKWPEIPGVQTAVVTGPAGEEIYTDKYGRIRIQFHWDREGKKDDKSSCWVRTMLPWTGKNWGMIAIPRIGQEVVVQFEEGDPDRPLVVGMLYNAETMPPYKLPDKMTQSGVKTNSTKGGGGFNELMFEDKKDAELVRFQSQLNYQQIVRNDATITVGLEAKDKGDMALTVQNDLTEIVKEGDHSFTVETGSQKIEVKKDFTETVEGKATQTITGNVARTVKSGNVTEDVKKGNVARTVDMGNVTDTLKLGDFSLVAKAGKISMTALKKIELKCGPSSIVLGPDGIVIKGMKVNVEGQIMAEVKGKITQIKGDGMVIVKGGVTMIN
jgi:type VI secretion system secreted protein VgrG